MEAGYSITIYFPAEHQGLREALLTARATRVFAFHRNLWRTISAKREFDGAGVYILLGESDESPNLTSVYIGEGDSVKDRLDAHNKQNDRPFWSSTHVLSTVDLSMHKAHIQYIESELIRLAKEAKVGKVVNATEPDSPTMMSHVRDEARYFLSDFLLCIAALGIDVFNPPTRQVSVKSDAGDVGSRLFLKSEKYHVEATCLMLPEGFLVLSGSTMRKTETEKIPVTYRNLRQRLLESGVITEQGDLFRFDSDYLFKTSSAAASVIQGSSVSGNGSWKDANGRFLPEILKGL